MRNKHAGFLMLVVAVLLVVIAGFATAFVMMITSGSNSSTSVASGTDAYDLAYTGVEAGSYDLLQGNCNASWNTETVLGPGTFKYNCTQYNASSTLSITLTNTATSIPISSTTGFANLGEVIIDSEMIYYNGISGNTLLNARRGANGTSAASHAAGASISQQEYIIAGQGSVPSSSNPYGQKTISQAVLLSQGGNAYYAVGGNGVMLKYDGTSSSWSSVLSVNGLTFRGIDMNSSYGLAVGSDSSNNSYVYAFNGTSWFGPIAMSVYISYNGGSFSGPVTNTFMANSNLYVASCNVPNNPSQCWIGGSAPFYNNNQPGPLLCSLSTAGIAICYITTYIGNVYVSDLSCNNSTCVAAVTNNNMYNYFVGSSTPWNTFNNSSSVPFNSNPLNEPAQTMNVSCFSASSCLVATSNGIRYYYNSLGAYTQININGFSPISVSCPSSSLCMMAGANGQIYSCTMGSSSISCTKQSTPGSQNLTGIHCNSNNDCLIVGSGRAYRYLNGTWTSVNIPGGVSLNAVSGSSSGGGSSGLQWLNSN